MRMVSNAGTDRVVDLIQRWLAPGHRMDLASEALSLHAFAELADELSEMSNVRLLLPSEDAELGLFGSDADRAARNRLQGRWLARRCADWIEKAAEVRRTDRPVPQGAVVLRSGDGHPGQAVLGSFSFSTDGLGLAPGNPLNLIHASETPEESRRLSEWFDGKWSALAGDETAKTGVVELLRSLAVRHDPHCIYALILNHVFRTGADELDAEQVVKSATGIRNTVVWKKLFKFQRDGIVGAIDKLNRFGGCIIADSVGLGKTFEALAVIKYHELRNDRVLVLCPKRLRDNWSLYRANDRRNFLAGDRFNYDILNHTDLSRDGGLSGDLDNQANRDNAERAYNLIMREKEKLLSLDTPLKFIFSHSALREGWDNPNVFQICALRDIQSKRERRQTIGRGLRLCVNQEGQRLRGFEVNTLTVVAMESYEAFAENLQKEIEADTGFRFGVVERHQFAAIPVDEAGGKTNVLGFEASEALWEHLQDEGYIDTKGRVQDSLRGALKDETLVVPEEFAPQQAEIVKVLRRLAGRLEIKNADERRRVRPRQAVLRSPEFKALWDRIKHKTTYRVAFDNEDVLEKCARALREAPPIPRTRLQWRKADIAIGQAGVEATETSGSATVVLDDWAVLIDTDEGERLYFVVETKGSSFLDDLRIPESAKIACGRAHFGALRVRESAARYEVATGVDELLAAVDVSRSAPKSSAHDA